MKKRTSSSSLNSTNGNQNNNMKKPPPPPPEAEEEEDDRKPAARPTTNDSQAPTDQSVGSNASSSTVACKPKGEDDLVHHLATIHEHVPARTMPPMAAQVAVLGGASLASFVAFIVIILPSQALAALIFSIASAMLMLYQLSQFAVQAYHDALNGRGIGDFLPGWLFSMLVEDSIHQQLTDPSFNLEWRHMALYFFPGLSRAQINAFVDRLPPRHRDFLLRPGAGHVLGDDFMQLLLGRERFPEVPRPVTDQVALPAEASNNNNNNTVEALPSPRNDEDSVAEGEAQTTSRDLANPTRQQSESRSLQLPPAESISSPPRAIVATPAAATESEEEEAEYDSEFTILVEAFAQGMNSMVLVPALDLALQMLDRVTALVTSPRVSLALVSGSMGVFGYWRGLFGRSGIRPNVTFHDRDVWATAVLGGGVAGILLFALANRPKKKKGGKK